jgi:hypothetical protein
MQTAGRSAPSQGPTRARLTGDKAWTSLDRNREGPAAIDAPRLDRTSSSKSLVSMLRPVSRLLETIETFVKVCDGMAERLS